MTGRTKDRSSLRAQLAGVRNAIAIPRKPAITRMQQPVESWQTEYRIERPRPPDTPRDIEINVGAGNELAIGCQQSNVGEQRINRHLQLLGDPGLL